MLSKTLEEYDSQKGVALTAAKRMGEFLGNDLVSGKGLNCYFIIAQKPIGAPINERAIPVSIFNADESIKRKFLKKWLKESDIKDTDMRYIIDWDYYIERLSNTIQKMLTIPSALQKIKNPTPRVAYPEWLSKQVRDADKYEQKKMGDFFKKVIPEKEQTQIMDIEDVLQDPNQLHEARVKTKLMNKNIKAYISVSKNPTPSGKVSKDKASGSVSSSQNLDQNILNSSQLSKLSELYPQETHDMEKDFDGWLKSQKALWRHKRKRKFNDDYSPVDPSNKITAMFRSLESHVLTSVWHILQIHETDTPGIYKMWVYLESSQLVSFKLRMKRTFYINSLHQENVEDFKLVKKKLPRDKKSYYLYERTIEEEEFINKFHSFDQFLTNPDIEGIYETKVPLDFKFVSEAGSIVRLYRNKEKHYSGYSNYLFDFDELRPLYNYEKPYLTDFNLPFLVLSQLSLK